MFNRYPRATLLASVTALLSLHASVSQADTILVPTGGSLTGVTPTTVSATYGPLSATQVEQIAFAPGAPANVQTALLSGSYAPTGLDLSGTANTYVSAYDGSKLFGKVSGDLGFDLTSPGSVAFSWSQSPWNQKPGSFLNIDPYASVQLVGPGGITALGCVGSDGGNNVAGGCVVGAPPPNGFNHGALDRGGTLALAAGHYDLMFAVNSSIATGVPIATDFSFRLSPVPVPPAVYLLLSGLIGVTGPSRIKAIVGSRRRVASCFNGLGD